MTWPDEITKLIFMPRRDDRLDELATLAEPEDWDYRNTLNDFHKPVLFNYLKYTYKRLAEEDKIVIADDGSAIAFNTGLVTPSQVAIFCYCQKNFLQDKTTEWHFTAWRRKGEYDLTRFSTLPEMAHYFSDPSSLVLDTRRDFRINTDHIISENKERFPEPYRSMLDFQLSNFLNGAISSARERVKRNYKTAIPQYYRGQVQLLLPLCLSRPDIADLALVIESHDAFYRAATCLTLDMAYNNARQLARPDRDWLQP